MSDPTNDRARIRAVQVLSNDRYILRKTTFEFRRNDGNWVTMTRETYDRGNGATILLYNRATQTVVLTRQFRFPAFVNGYHGFLIETCAGLLDADNPGDCIRRETEEETGFRVRDIRKVFEAFMSPGSVTERLFFFVAEYTAANRVGDGGGLATDGEDIEVLEVDFDTAMEMIDSGEIIDGKTIMMLLYAKVKGLLG
jgi:nudix-type nucleoside diphosphatase (YffH/AdpP family)